MYLRVTRLLSIEDATELADIQRANRAYLAPWEPSRDADFYTQVGQAELIGESLAAYEQGNRVPLAILGPNGELAGRLNINGITYGAWQSAAIGYWVRQECAGHGLASAAVADALDLAFERLELHRVQAETLLHNTASQRVLEKNGFRVFGMAPKYLKIDGRWQDHLLYQRLVEQ